MCTGVLPTVPVIWWHPQNLAKQMLARRWRQTVSSRASSQNNKLPVCDVKELVVHKMLPFLGRWSSFHLIQSWFAHLGLCNIYILVVKWRKKTNQTAATEVVKWSALRSAVCRVHRRSNADTPWSCSTTFVLKQAWLTWGKEAADRFNPILWWTYNIFSNTETLKRGCLSVALNMQFLSNWQLRLESPQKVWFPQMFAARTGNL